MSYGHILLSPEDYTRFGAVSPSPYSMNDIPKSVKDYNNSDFLRNVYPTLFKAVTHTKLTPEEKIYRVIIFALPYILFFNFFFILNKQI